jgi:hypothetical protein
MSFSPCLLAHTISVECCRKEEEEGEDMVGGDRSDHQEKKRREAASIQHIKIPMVNRKVVKFR